MIRRLFQQFAGGTTARRPGRGRRGAGRRGGRATGGSGARIGSAVERLIRGRR